MAKFELGNLHATRSVLAVLAEAGESHDGFIDRHRAGDWGIVSDGDKELNDLSAAAPDGEGDAILSAYVTKTGIKIWVWTERDRSSTTVLLPSEY